MTNSKRWQDNSDGWVTAMTKSKDHKAEYQEYLKTTENPVHHRYIDWLTQVKNNEPT